MIQNRWRRVVTELWYRRLFKSIGPGTVIQSNCTLINTEFMSLGARVLIRSGTRIETILHDQPWTPVLAIGDNVNIEQNVHIVCHDRIIIEDNVSITGCCAIVDVSHPHIAALRDEKVGAGICSERSYVRIGSNSFIGFGAVILPNVDIGKNCYIGAGSVVTRNIPDDSVVAGVPARALRTL